MEKHTICKIIENLKPLKHIKNDKYVLQQLDQIQKNAEAMEDRLLKYCNAIEDLGFIRLGRDYTNQ